MKLYPFQKELVDRFETTPSILIGDDMGLGKTVEAIALDLRRRSTQLEGYKQTNCKTMVVAPLSVLSSWEYHIKALWPSARVYVIDPKNRAGFIAALKQPYHYYVMHWEALRLLEEIHEVHWWHIIADEVHRAKNRKALQTVQLKKLRTSYKTAMSGTPADNAPQDLWSVLNWLYPKTWTSFWSFTRYFVLIRVHNVGTCLIPTCDKYHRNSYKETLGVANVEELQDSMKGYYIRRLKEEVIADLPEKYYTQIDVELPVKQRRIYRQMQDDMLAWVGKHEADPIAAPIIVAQLTRLKQFALAYAETIKVKRKRDGETYTALTVKLSEPSSKLDAVMDILEDNPDQQVVVFSESKQIINLLAARLVKAKISHALLTGDTAQSQRGTIVDEFQAGRVRVFAGTISAGGVGITLTASSTVIFLDRTWNPSLNKQAEDRLHRIGQKSAVQVIDIVATNTVDGGRLQQVKLKWEWLKELLGDKTEKVAA